MGRRKFGPQTGEWPDDGWRGWWGDEPPFRTPVFVMSHHEHRSIEFPNGTSFHFVNAPPHEVLHLARKATNGRDVRIGGGPSTVRQFLHADLIDFMHLVIVPITLGRGVFLWEGLSGLEDRFTVETLTSPSGITHQLWNRRASNVLTASARCPCPEVYWPTATRSGAPVRREDLGNRLGRGRRPCLRSNGALIVRPCSRTRSPRRR